MRGERGALRAGELLVSLASRWLPPGIRQERRQEWLAELPVILRDRDAGPAPVRIVRMLAFAADTVRGTAVAPQTYHGAHRGRSTTAKDLRRLGTGLLMLGLLGLLLGGGLFILADEGFIAHQLATGPTLTFSVTLVLINLVFFALPTGHVALVRGVRAQCLLQATGRAPDQLGGITRLFVGPAGRRQGTARALLEVAAAHAREQGLQPVLDVVADGLAAIALYERAGWKLAGTESATWTNADGVSPVVRYYVGPRSRPP